MVKFNGTPNIPPYGSHVDVADRTAIGKVVCKTALGRYDNSINIIAAILLPRGDHHELKTYILRMTERKCRNILDPTWHH